MLTTIPRSWHQVSPSNAFRTITSSSQANSTFSPEGRLFQVEYSLEAIKLGSTAIGVCIPTLFARKVTYTHTFLGCNRRGRNPRCRKARNLHPPRNQLCRENCRNRPPHWMCHVRSASRCTKHGRARARREPEPRLQLQRAVTSRELHASDMRFGAEIR
jgi:hypothetical protein